MENRNNDISVKRIVAAVLTTFTVLGLAVYGIYFNVRSEKAENDLENQYRRTFADMTDYVASAENYILKALSSGTPGTTSAMLEEASKCSAQAESCLTSLPIDQRVTEKISGFLVQLEDVSRTWSRRPVNGGILSDSEYDTLTELYGYAQDLSGRLYALSADIDKNVCSWADISNDSGKILGKNTISPKYASLGKLSDPFTEYPTLIYDGPFSEHMSDTEPKGLTGDTLSPEAAENKAKMYFTKITGCDGETGSEDSGEGSGACRVKKCGENSYNGIDTYCFTADIDGAQAHIDITKKGGMLYSFIYPRECGEQNLSTEQGIEAGKSFLQSIGMTSMASSYYTAENGFITVNYSYENDGILYYPDMVKVKIALDNGSPVAFEGHGYIACHDTGSSRISPASISVSDAENVLSPHLTVDTVREVVAPDDHGGEYHAYEFSCTLMGRPVLVYIDAETGIEKDVLIILEGSDGILTV